MCPMCKRLIADHDESEADACINALRNKPLWPYALLGGITGLILLYITWTLFH